MQDPILVNFMTIITNHQIYLIQTVTCPLHPDRGIQIAPTNAMWYSRNRLVSGGIERPTHRSIQCSSAPSHRHGRDAVQPGHDGREPIWPGAGPGSILQLVLYFHVLLRYCRFHRHCLYPRQHQLGLGFRSQHGG